MLPWLSGGTAGWSPGLEAESPTRQARLYGVLFYAKTTLFVWYTNLSTIRPGRLLHVSTPVFPATVRSINTGGGP